MSNSDQIKIIEISNIFLKSLYDVTNGNCNAFAVAAIIESGVLMIYFSKIAFVSSAIFLSMALLLVFIQ